MLIIDNIYIRITDKFKIILFPINNYKPTKNINE
jgi:hypothetical protein